MEKRYQVFVSSTFTDLKEERRKITQTLMEMDCIPAGMELFPAADLEQWEFIKKVIDDCDYYLIIIGGRYGSLTAEGISFTEKEFDYAVKKGLKVVALIHKNPESLDKTKLDSDPELMKKLDAFRLKVSTDRLVKHWEKLEDIAALVALNMQKTIKIFPAVGWVRNPGQSSESLLAEINELRKENSALKDQIEKMNPLPLVENIAGLDEHIVLKGTYYVIGYGERGWSFELSWRQLFADIAPVINQDPTQETVKKKLGIFLFQRTNKDGDDPSINEQDFNTITIQFKALGLIETESIKSASKTNVWFWKLTPKGEKLMFEERAVRNKV